MDPEETYMKIQGIITLLENTPDDHESRPALYDELVSAWLDLDDWISSGGFLPRPWRPRSQQSLGGK